MVATYCPKTLEEAIQIRMEKSVIPFAGGTDLMVKYKSTRGALPAFPGDILYLGSLDELKAIEIRDDGIGIGAGVSLSSLILEKGLPDYIKAPVLGIGSPSIRNLGTIGGNICNASPAGDTIPFLYALDSILELKSLEGVRRMGIADFIKGPGKTELKADEILTGIFIPRPDFSRWGYRKVGARKANAISKLSVFYLADIRDSFLKDIRIAFGSVGPRVFRSREMEKKMIGLSLDQLKGNMEAILGDYGKILSPISDVRSTRDYRRDVSLNILKDMIERGLMP